MFIVVIYVSNWLFYINLYLANLLYNYILVPEVLPPFSNSLQMIIFWLVKLDIYRNPINQWNKLPRESLLSFYWMPTLIMLYVSVKGDSGGHVPYVTMTLLLITWCNIPISQGRKTIIMVMYTYQIFIQDRISPFQGENNHYSFRFWFQGVLKFN